MEIDETFLYLSSALLGANKMHLTYKDLLVAPLKHSSLVSALGFISLLWNKVVLWVVILHDSIYDC